jgi:hypothetical protein
MAAIRALLVSIAKHNGIQIPAEALLLGNSVSTKGSYESAKTIEYQLQQRPTKKTCSSTQWDEIFRPFGRADLVLERPDTVPETGLATVLLWTVPRDANLSSAYVNYDEFGYDQDGYVCKLQRGDPQSESSSNPSAPGVGLPAGNGRCIEEHIVS